MQNDFSPISLALIIACAVWVLPWKGWALWRASQKKQFSWFAVLLVFNFAAVLEIFYTLIVSREKVTWRSYAVAAVSILISVTLISGLLVSFDWQPTSAACSQEAKVCADGSAVGRTGKNCTFAPCPGGNEPLTGAPSAESFPAERTYSGAPATVDFTTNSDARIFRTLLTRGAASGPNFAGAYAVVTWGCGTTCQMSAIIDAVTGAIIAYGIPSSSGLTYSKESRLLVVNPYDPAVVDSETSVASDYYALQNGRLQYVGKFDGRTGEAPLCIQVVTKAVSPITKERVEFPSPCRVPFGWQVVEP